VRHGGVFLLIIISMLLLSSPATGQRNSDWGLMVAVPWYMGDLSPNSPQPVFSPPAFGGIFRYNFNMRNSLRAHVVKYDLIGEGEIFGGTQADFNASFVDLGLDFEFNWWPYKTAYHRTKYSPYVSAGLGYGLDLFGDSKSHLYIPFGGGVKVNLGKRLSSGVEVNMRKTFTDRIDGVVNAGGEGVESPVGNNDWYMFTGLFFTYKILNYENDCPAFAQPVYDISGKGGKRIKSDHWNTNSYNEPATKRRKKRR